jgi:hypothetical protein
MTLILKPLLSELTIKTMTTTNRTIISTGKITGTICEDHCKILTGLIHRPNTCIEDTCSPEGWIAVCCHYDDGDACILCREGICGNAVP